jgi:hypothetical protein
VGAADNAAPDDGATDDAPDDDHHHRAPDDNDACAHDDDHGADHDDVPGAQSVTREARAADNHDHHGRLCVSDAAEPDVACTPRR